MMHKAPNLSLISLIFALTVLCYPMVLRAECSLSIDDPTQGFEGGGGANIITFTVTKTGNSACTTLFSTSDDTATGGGQCTTNVDYVSLINGGLNFSATDTTKTIVITTCGDGVDEPDETFVINLFSPSGATYTKGQGRGTLVDDDPPPDLRINNANIPEGNTGQSSGNLNVTLSNPSAFTVTVDYATAANTATAGTACGGNTDFVTTTGTLTFNPNQTTKQAQIPVCGDTATESNETFRVNLSNAAHASIAGSQATGTITNDDLQPNITINDVTRNEGNTGQANATFAVSLSAAGTNQITVNYTTVPIAPTVEGVCGTGNADYRDASGTLTFNAGSATPQNIVVPICGDTTVELNDLFRVNLSAATNANISDNQGQGTIQNDDLPTLSIAAVQKNEGNFGQTAVTLTITASSANPAGASVVCVPRELRSPPPAPFKAATGGSACTGGLTSPTDFILASRGIKANFGPTSTSATCTVTVCGDSARELDELFNVELINPQGATIANGSAGVLIKNDD